MELTEENVMNLVRERLKTIPLNKVPYNYRWITVIVKLRKICANPGSEFTPDPNDKIVWQLHSEDLLVSEDFGSPDTDPRVPFHIPNVRDWGHYIVFRAIAWQWGRVWELLPDECYEQHGLTPAELPSHLRRSS